MSGFLFILVLASSLTLVSPHADGSGACFDNPTSMLDFLSNHQEPICHPERSQFGLYTSQLSVANALVAGCKYTISLCGPKPFKGFLTYAQIPTMTPSRIGSWSSPSSTPSKTMPCSGNGQGTITHSTPASKIRADFTFQTPEWVNSTERNAKVTIQARIVVSLTEWYTTSIILTYLNINNMNGAVCPDPVSLPLTACPSQGIVDTSGCSATAAPVNPHAGHDMGGGMNMGDMNMGSNINTTSNLTHDMSSMPSSMDHSTMPMGSSMSAVFSTSWFGIALVFPGFTITTTGAYVGALLCCMGVALCLELIQWMQNHYDASVLKQHRDENNCSSSRSDSRIEKEEEFKHVNLFSSKQQATRSFLHAVRVFLSLFLMMIWMTLNLGLVLAALAGSGIGFYLFQQRQRENTAHVGVPSNPTPQCC